MARDVLLPVETLAPYVRHVMVGGFDGDIIHLPACADVQLLVYLHGGASLIDPAGTETPLSSIFLVGAVTHPRRYRVEADSRFVAVTFRPGGLYACLGISAADVMNRITSFDTAASILHALRQTGEAGAPQLLQAILEERRGVSAAPMPALDPATLSQPVRVLARQLGISVRQFERRCLVSLGMPLREYRRLSRYSSAMMALMLQGASPQSLAALAQEAHYVDQAHFTRDFSALAGSPPGRLTKQRGQAQYQLWQFTRDELESYLS